MHRHIGIAVALLGFWSGSSAMRIDAAPAVVAVHSPIPVRVTSTANEQMARRLSSAVLKEFGNDRRFSVSDNASPAAVTLLLPDQVGWERRLDWTMIKYQARLNSANGQSRVIAGECWNWNLKVCAKQMAAATVEFAGGK